MQFFDKVNMASESIDSYMRSGIVYSNGSPADSFAGAIVTPTGIVEGRDENVFKFEAPTDTKQTNLFILDPVKVPEATNGDLVYRMGVKTLGLTVKAGELVAARKLALNDQFIVGNKNFADAANPAKGEKYGATANASTFTKVDGSEEDNSFLVRVDDVRSIAQGVGIAGIEKGYLLTVVKLG